MTANNDLTIKLLAARHDPDAMIAVLDAELSATTDVRDIVSSIATALVSTNQLVHRFCHMVPNLDELVDTIVAAGPSALNADMAQGVPTSEFLTPEFTRQVWEEYTQGTDPVHRLWDVRRLSNGQRVITLDGPEFNRRVFAPVGATDEQIDQFLAAMKQYEAELK